MDAERIHLGLDLDLDGHPIAGELTPPGGSPRPFTGYAGLIAAVETIREGRAPGAGSDRDGPRRSGIDVMEGAA